MSIDQTSLDSTRLEVVSTLNLLHVSLRVQMFVKSVSIIMHMIILHVGFDSRVFMAVGPVLVDHWGRHDLGN